MFYDIYELAKIIEVQKTYRTIIATSGGFDPLHIGHVRCLNESKNIDNTASKSLLIAIVNGDSFLTRKKGKPFMKLEERMEIVNALRSVDFVVPWDDGSQTVIGALEILKPHIFTKGGDRSDASKVPEAEICDKIGCQIIYGVGGKEKIQSSSKLTGIVCVE